MKSRSTIFKVYIDELEGLPQQSIEIGMIGLNCSQRKRK